MRALVVATIVVGVLVFLFLYFEAKARAYRGKMEAFAVSAGEPGSAPAQDPASARSEPSVGPGQAAVDHDDVDADRESMGLPERRIV
jgi:hypothetical protein